MATGSARSTRKLKPWLLAEVESGKYPGLVWDDDQKTCFRIPWKHAGKQDFRHDEDAAIFKAWAMFKNKFRQEDKLDAAAWKTRLRCALNKSPEFEEVPERSQLDISEPYKVYRIVPLGEQVHSSSARQTRKRKHAADHRDSSSDEEKIKQEKNVHQIITLELSLVDANISSTISPEDSGIGSDASSTEILTTHHNPESLTILPVLPLEITHTDMQITVLYSGVEVSQTLVRSGECKLSAGSPLVRTTSSMEHVPLPVPDDRLDSEICKQTQTLLHFLQSGVMLASNIHGIFAQRQRSCSGRVFWTGPCANHGGEPNKLERDAHMKLFDMQNFLRELELYRTQGGAPPDYLVTLCFGEEISDCDPSTKNLITAQIEQVMAAEMVREATAYLQGAQASDPLLQGPPAPYISPLTPLDLPSTLDPERPTGGLPAGQHLSPDYIGRRLNQPLVQLTDTRRSNKVRGGASSPCAAQVVGSTCGK
ncbi:interferon regulatory factor 9 [Pelodytes ibericus]